MSIKRLYLKEDPQAKKAMANIVRRGIKFSPESERKWGDALLQAVDTFDIEIRKAASAAGDKDAAKAKVDKGKVDKGKKDGGGGYDPKVATRASKEKEPDPELSDDWFLDDGPDLDPTGTAQEPTPPKAKGKAKKKSPEPPPPADDAGDDGFPDLPEPKSANFLVGGEDDEDYVSPFANLGLQGHGHSSWEDVPGWMRDPEMMPRFDGKGSQWIRGRAPHDDTGSSGPSPVGRPWTDDDLSPKRTGLLGRLFGRKKKKQ